MHPNGVEFPWVGLTVPRFDAPFLRDTPASRGFKGRRDALDAHIAGTQRTRIAFPFGETMQRRREFRAAVAEDELDIQFLIE
jgi:hypothetical protein